MPIKKKSTCGTYEKTINREPLLIKTDLKAFILSYLSWQFVLIPTHTKVCGSEEETQLRTNEASQ